MTEQETSSDPKMAATQAWLAGRAAKAAEAKAPAESAPEAPAEKAPAPEPVQAEAPEKPEVAAPSSSATKALAAKLSGKQPAPEKGAWNDSATQALKRAGMRDEEVQEMQALAAEKPWFGGWLDKLQKVQAKQDADFAALKAGTREPTSTPARHQAAATGDQPGSGQIADVLEQLTKRFGEELGDENATLLRQVLTGQEQRLADLQQRLDGYTRSVTAEREAAEIEATVQRTRHELREEFPWIDDEAKFEALAREMTALRPDELSPEGIKQSMRKAARIVFFDDVRADAKAVASKLDTKRKNRSAETAPGGNSADQDEAPLGEFEISLRAVKMQAAGEPKERISRWVQAQHERRRKANQR